MHGISLTLNTTGGVDITAFSGRLPLKGTNNKLTGRREGNGERSRSEDQFDRRGSSDLLDGEGRSQEQDWQTIF
jgi:hypothetical protein